MGEEQQMQKKQTSLTKKLSDGKRRDLEERKEDENNMGEKCVKEARERDRREPLKEKRRRQIAEEKLTHMEKQMMEREGEGEGERELESQIREDMRKREEERKHEEEIKMKRLEEDLMKEKKQRQIAEENMTHMEKQMRLESQIREDMRKHEEEMKMRKLEDMNNEMFGKMRELEERMIKMERQHAEKTTMEEEKEERKRVEDTVRMKDFSIFAAATVKTQGPGEDQLAIEGKTNDTQTDQAAKVKGEQDLDIDCSESDYDSEGTMDSDNEYIGKDEFTKWRVDIEEKKACTQLQHDGNTAERDDINQEKKKVQPAKCKDVSIFSAGAQTQQTQQCKAGKNRLAKVLKSLICKKKRRQNA
ncbi:uncharacterized protein ACWYII_041321 isoform 1-T1 [Salvelinus alpinus]